MRLKHWLITNFKLFLMTVTIMFVIGIIVFNFYQRDAIIRNQEKIMIADNEVIKGDVDAYLDKYITIVEMMGNSPAIVEYIRSIQEPEDLRNHPLFQEVTEGLQRIRGGDVAMRGSWIAINAVNSFIIDDMTYVREAVYPDYVFYERPFYREMFRTDEAVVITPFYWSGIDEGQMICSIYMPIMKEGEELHGREANIGQIGIDIEITSIHQIVSDYVVGDKGFAIVADRDGRLIGAPDGFLEYETVLDNEDFDVLGPEMISLSSGSGIYKINGQSYYVVYNPVGHGGWSVATFVPYMEIRQQLLLINGLSLVFAIMAIGIMWGVFTVTSVNHQNTELHLVNEKLISQGEELKQKTIEANAAYQQIRASEEILSQQYDEIQSYAQKLVEKEDRIRDLAYQDPLTQIPNRRKFMEILQESVRTEDEFAVMLLDLDNFKDVNDTFGHIYGDELLKRVSSLLNTFTGDDILISRFGGDEFLIQIKNYTSEAALKEQIYKIVKILNDKYVIHDNELYISVSAGVSRYPLDSQVIGDLLQYADTAMYTVKFAGKNSFALFDESMRTDMSERWHIENIITEALDSKRFKLLYQPQFNVRTGELVAFEALIRLMDYDMSPAVFIPITEESNKIIGLGRRVTEEVVRQLAQWKAQFDKPVPVAINFSAKQIMDRSYIDFLTAKLEEYQVEPELVHIEITESVFLENKETTLNFLNKLRREKITIALDDFGTGYSSLSYLTYLPINKLKLDKTLADRFLNEASKDIYGNIIAISHSLELEVVAEGIETIEQLELLGEINCNLIQGYVLSQPLEVEDAEKYIEGSVENITVEEALV